MAVRSLVVALFSVIGFIPEAYGVSVDGLKLDSLGEKSALSRTNNDSLECKNLNDLFQHFSFREMTKEKVEVQLSDEVPPDSLVDTDDESSVQPGDESKVKSVDKKLTALSVIKRKEKVKNRLNRSRYVGKNTDIVTYAPPNNYLTQWPAPGPSTGKPTTHPPINVDELRTRSLCSQLTSDAFLISESGITDRPGSTTCLCVALRDKFGYIKKFVFHNGENLLAPSIRAKACELGYDVIQAEQSHAEGQFIQFLLDRHRKRPGWYTHILGIGCSRSHCAECNALLKLYLGGCYNEFTSSVNTRNNKKEYIEEDSPDTITTRVCEVSATTSDTGKLILNKRIERTGTVVYGQNTIDERSFEKFYLPLSLKDSMQEKLDASIYFDEGRFTRSKKRNQQSHHVK